MVASLQLDAVASEVAQTGDDQGFFVHHFLEGLVLLRARGSAGRGVGETGNCGYSCCHVASITERPAFPRWPVTTTGHTWSCNHHPEDKTLRGNQKAQNHRLVQWGCREAHRLNAGCQELQPGAASRMPSRRGAGGDSRTIYRGHTPIFPLNMLDFRLSFCRLIGHPGSVLKIRCPKHGRV